MKITILEDLCIKCGACTSMCPAYIFRQDNPRVFPAIVDPDLCIKCGHCVMVCPVDAVSHENFIAKGVNRLNQDMQPSSDQVFHMLKTRRSIRGLSAKPVERQLIEKIIDSARFAPSAHNSQSTEYVVVQDKATLRRIVEISADYLDGIAKTLRNPVGKATLRMLAGRQIDGAVKSIDRFSKIAEAVREGQDPILRNAPVFLGFHADESASLANANANLALQNASLACQALGLGCFYTGYVVATCARDNKIAMLFGIASTNKIYAGLAIGYPRFEYKNWVDRNPARIKWI